MNEEKCFICEQKADKEYDGRHYCNECYDDLFCVVCGEELECGWCLECGRDKEGKVLE